MKRSFSLTVILALVAGTSARAADLNLRVVSGGLDAVTVAPGDPVSYEVLGVLSSTVDNQGLALFGFDLALEGANCGVSTVCELPHADLQDRTADPAVNPLLNFDRPLGITNPDGEDPTGPACPPACGIGGTVISGKLVQIGGGQNSINNTANNAPFPTGAVMLMLGHSEMSMATGTFTAPMEPGTYTLTIPRPSVFANVITAAATGMPFWPTETAPTGTIGNLTLTVQAPVIFESVATHGGFGEIGIAPEATGATGIPAITEPRASGISRVVVTTGGTINAATAIPANVTVVGQDAAGPVDLTGVGIDVQAVGNELTIGFTPQLPNEAVYRISLTGVLDANNVPIAGSRCLAALLGDINGDRVVNVFDFSAGRAFVGQPFDAANEDNVRADIQNDGVVNVFDFSAARGGINTSVAGVACPAP